jgi:hypothetical protein
MQPTEENFVYLTEYCQTRQIDTCQILTLYIPIVLEIAHAKLRIHIYIYLCIFKDNGGHG